MSTSHTTPSKDNLYFDDDTMDKVYDVMREDGGLTEKQTRNLIRVLRTKGFVFREKRETVSTSPVSTPRGVQDDAVPVAKVSSDPPVDQPTFPEGQARGFAQYLGGSR